MTLNQYLKINDRIILTPWADFGSYCARYPIDEEYDANNRVCIFYLYTPFYINFFGKLKDFQKLFLAQHKQYSDRNQIEKLQQEIDQFLIRVGKLKSFI
jgi:hypothetical protein